MMNGKIRLAVAAATIGLLSAVATAPVGAQTPPTLGFEVDVTDGAPGDLVNGQVDVDDVAELCTTTVEELQGKFQGLNDVLMQELLLTYWPDGEPLGTPERAEQLSFTVLALITEVLAADPALAETALDQTFVMTFADIVTQQPIGERANFDPAVGQATVTVPDVQPGLWAVAATCVEPTLDLAALRAGITEGAAFLRDALDLPPDPLPADGAVPPDFDFFAFLQENAASILAPVMTPQAVGFSIFCVQDASGVCPGSGPRPGPVTPPAAPPATPVPGRPSFTG